MGQALQHQPDHRGVNYRCAGRAEPRIVHAEPTTLSEPAEGLFDDPATGPHADVLPIRNTVIPLPSSIWKRAGLVRATLCNTSPTG